MLRNKGLCEHDTHEWLINLESYECFNVCGNQTIKIMFQCIDNYYTHKDMIMMIPTTQSRSFILLFTIHRVFRIPN